MNFADRISKHMDAMSSIFQPGLNWQNTIPIDLSGSNREFDGLSEGEWDGAIERKISDARAIAAVGGYLEDRQVYRDKPNFVGEEDRSVHIGVDVFMPADTALFAPLNARVHCITNRPTSGDYGPVIVLRHELEGLAFHTLYGHLSMDTLNGLKAGQTVTAGDRIGAIGARPTNGDWPPHLHFQVIIDLQELDDNYPGVARPSDLDFYRQNCPDPMPFLVR
ncbi:MAG: peptidoglycan DD-metalloendopeptidase family protein [Pseudomonadota bacterium]